MRRGKNAFDTRNSTCSSAKSGLVNASAPSADCAESPLDASKSRRGSQLHNSHKKSDSTRTVVSKTDVIESRGEDTSATQQGSDALGDERRHQVRTVHVVPVRSLGIKTTEGSSQRGKSPTDVAQKRRVSRNGASVERDPLSTERAKQTAETSNRKQKVVSVSPDGGQRKRRACTSVEKPKNDASSSEKTMQHRKRRRSERRGTTSSNEPVDRTFSRSRKSSTNNSLNALEHSRKQRRSQYNTRSTSTDRLATRRKPDSTGVRRHDAEHSLSVSRSKKAAYYKPTNKSLRGVGKHDDNRSAVRSSSRCETEKRREESASRSHSRGAHKNEAFYTLRPESSIERRRSGRHQDAFQRREGSTEAKYQHVYRDKAAEKKNGLSPRSVPASRDLHKEGPNSIALMPLGQGRYSATTPVKVLQFHPKPPGPVEGPPPPLQPPSTIAQLRVLLLLGLVSSETLPPAAARASAAAGRDIPRFAITCPIHSAMIAQMIRDYFVAHQRLSTFGMAALRGPLIARELQMLAAAGFSDPHCGPIAPLVKLDVISPDAVILSSFDFLRCDFVLRATLRPEHPSLGVTLWDAPALGTAPQWPLTLGAGVGVEAREAQLKQLGLVELDGSEGEDGGAPCSTKPQNNLLSRPKSLDAAAPDANETTESSRVQQPLSKASLYDNPLASPSRPSVNEPYHPLPPLHSGSGGIAADHCLHRAMPRAPATSKNAAPFPLALFPANPQPLALRQNSLSAPLLMYPDVPVAPPNNLVSATSNSSAMSSPADPTDSMSIEALLSAPSAKEQQLRDSGAELRQLLTVPTAKHSITTRAFQNRGGSRVQQICRHGTRHDCLEAAVATYNQRRLMNPQEPPPKACGLIHFRRILLPHTDVSLGDCSYLDTCRHMASCRFVHYEVDLDVGSAEQKSELLERMEATDQGSGVAHNIGTVFSGHLEELPAQWITSDVSIFHGKVKIVMADPPWDIHMDLPYGTMTDAEMKALRLDQVQDEGCLFLWVTGRAMELGRECMKLWGYQQVEEIVWVKTNQLHRLIRTGRTGHWLNHSKEHCLVGIKGKAKLNRNMDTDIIVAEVRETSRKPDEIYRIIERLCPGPYKLELFGRPHNVRDNWITLGNQLESIYLHDPQLIQRYNTFAQKAGLQQYLPSSNTVSQETDDKYEAEA